jgi:hypothetical protein
MTLYEFNAIDDEEEKLMCVLMNGECIGLREVDGQKITVYQLPAFYVEILPRPIVKPFYYSRRLQVPNN